MTGRHVRIALTPQPDPEADINVGKMRIRERLMRWLFGPMQDFTVLVPGHHVEDITISKKPTTSDKAEDLSDEQLDALAASMARHPAGKRRGLKRGETK